MIDPLTRRSIEHAAFHAAVDVSTKVNASSAADDKDFRRNLAKRFEQAMNEAVDKIVKDTCNRAGHILTETIEAKEIHAEPLLVNMGGVTGGRQA